ncbi:hypothetical protein GOBAR_AA14952 [Gossypium barbadense]|uniref:Retrotransposon gag domain-containing protein n=1 Tax=Gossypium barbadense TaxID=3634 RepID=A0A2P5XQS4_GOSBA|nr:hypothetical protein GOBAR_AA14952 [Gossypium barbadense]
MLSDSDRSHEVREKSHASSIDDMGDDFVPNTDDFDIPMGPVIPRVQPTPPAPPPSDAAQETPIERFHRYKMDDFYGTSEDDPIAAGQWLRDTLRTFRLLHFTSEGNLECIISLLKGDAYCWWETVEMALQAKQPTWDQFLPERFYEGLHIDIHTYLAIDPLEVFLELVRQAKAVERVLSMRLSSSNKSSIQSKWASNAASPSQIAAKRI